ncbi:hypothetical protein ACQ4PT_050299 [Festuca glaucescens]
MARKKVNLQYITNASTHRGTFKKRSRGMMKKACELSTLCGVNASVIIYDEGDSVPQVFPSHSEAVAILNRFNNMPELKQCKKTMDQESFLLQRIDKLQDQVYKSRRDSQEREIRLLLHNAMSGNLQDLAVLSTEELTYVGWNVDAHLKRISDRITKIRGQPLVYQPSVVHAPIPIISDDKNTIGPTNMYMDQAPFQQHEGWLNMVSSRGADLGAITYNGFNDGRNGTSAVGFKGDEMIQPFDLGDGSSCPWGATHPGLSSSYFPPM